MTSWLPYRSLLGQVFYHALISSIAEKLVDRVYIWVGEMKICSRVNSLKVQKKDMQFDGRLVSVFAAHQV